MKAPDFICPKIVGGLGNQLFILMAGYALSKDENTLLVIDPRNYAACPGRRVNIYWDTFLSNLKPFVRLGPRPKNDNVIKERNPFVYRKLIRKEKGRTQIKGYFQSYRYFNKYRLQILPFFELDAVIYSYLSNKYPWLDLTTSKHYKPVASSQHLLLAKDRAEGKEKESQEPERITNHFTIAIHVRRGDYVTKGHYVLPLIYYQKCLENSKDLINNMIRAGKRIVIVIFSDDTKWCETVLLPVINNFMTSSCLSSVSSSSTILQTGIGKTTASETSEIREAFQTLENLQKEPIITDKIVETNDGFNIETIVITGEKDYIELHMLQYFDHYFLANSTFSWWGAYLNRKKDVKVFLPGRWMSNQICPTELIYPGWIVVNF